MTYKLIISREVHDDIDAIVGYMVSELNSPAAAKGFLDDVDEGFRYMESNPFIYSLCPDARLAVKGIRKVVIKNYLILFRVDEKTSSVFVLRIVYGRKNYAGMI